MPLICVASPKGGVGKSSLTAALAAALRASGSRVVAIDCDPQNALRLHLGLPITETDGFLARIARRPDWRACLRETPSGIDLLPHGETDLRGALAGAALLEQDPDLLAAPLRALLADPRGFVVADTPPGASAALAALLPHAALVLAVLLADAGSTALLPDLDSGRFLGQGTLAGLRSPRIGVVLNQVDRGSALSVAAAEGVAGHLGRRLLGAVCRDEAMGEALAHQRPVGIHAPHSAAARDVEDLAAAVRREVAAPEPAAPATLSWLRA
jgi:cellulose synthase operon protein YhjQ